MAHCTAEGGALPSLNFSVLMGKGQQMSGTELGSAGCIAERQIGEAGPPCRRDLETSSLRAPLEWGAGAETSKVSQLYLS